MTPVVHIHPVDISLLGHPVKNRLSAQKNQEATPTLGMFLLVLMVPAFDKSPRGLFLDRYIIFYRILGDSIEILRVINARRDLPSIFEDQE